MTCREIENNLPAYLEDLLPPEEKGRVREHLASCRRCSRALTDLKQMETILSGLEEVTPPPWMKQKIMSSIREESLPEKGFFHRLFSPLQLKIPLSTAALVLISVLAFYVYRGQEPELRKEGVNIPLPPTVTGQRLEKGEAPREAPLPLSSPSPGSSRPVLRREIPPPPAAESREAFQPGTASPADQRLLALQKDLPQQAEGEPYKEKGKGATGQADSAGPESGKFDAVLPAPPEPKRGATLREAGSPGEFSPPRPSFNGFRDIGRAGGKAEQKAAAAKSSAPAARLQERHSRMTVAEIISLLQQSGALKVDRRISGEFETVTAELPSPMLKPLLQKLEDRGITGKYLTVIPVDAQQDAVSIRIELPRKP